MTEIWGRDLGESCYIGKHNVEKEELHVAGIMESGREMHLKTLDLITKQGQLEGIF